MGSALSDRTSGHGTQVGEAMPFIDELCLNLRAIISDLEPGQVHVFYEAVAYMVSAQAPPPPPPPPRPERRSTEKHRHHQHQQRQRQGLSGCVGAG